MPNTTFFTGFLSVSRLPVIPFIFLELQNNYTFAKLRSPASLLMFFFLHLGKFLQNFEPGMLFRHCEPSEEC